jgi:hypothetical protein
VKVAIPHSLGTYVDKKPMYFSFDSGTIDFVDNLIFLA